MSRLTRPLGRWSACLALAILQTDGREVPRFASPTAQLAHARQLKQTIYTSDDAARTTTTAKAVAAYRAVRRYHPGAHAIGAEAAFRAGRLLGAAGDGEGALAELASARCLAGGSEFGLRALLEIGRIHRRAGRREPALDAFLEVAADGNARGAYADDAWLEVAGLWYAAGRLGDARRAWRRVAVSGADPLERIRAYDRLGLSWTAAGDLEAAAGVLDECLRELSGIAREATRNGQRVRLALERMHLVKALSGAIEERLEGTARGTGSRRKP